MLTDAVIEQQTVIGNLVAFNHNIQTAMQQLDSRMVRIEYESKDLRSRLTSPFNLAVNEPQSVPARRPTWYHNGVDRRSSSPSPAQRERKDIRIQGKDEDILKGTTMGRIQKTKARKQLQITIPPKMSGPSNAAGLLTPLTKTAVSLPSKF